MADKQITVAVPEARVPEFYAWFASFLSSDPAAATGRGGPWGRPGRGQRHRPDAEDWSEQDSEQAAWLYEKLAPPARELFDLLAGSPGERFSGNDIAARLGLQAGAHGVAGILAWPGRYCRKLGRTFPISTTGREDGGTDYSMTEEIAALFTASVPPPAA